MDILWVTETYPPSKGGMSQSCDRIVMGLRKLGFNLHLIHFTNRRKAFQTERLERGTYSAVPVKESEAHTLNLFWNFIKNFQGSFDKIVVFGGYLPVIAGPVISKWLKIPMITLLRGNDFDTAVFTPRRRESLFYCLTNSESVGCVTREMIDKINLLEPKINLFYSPNGIHLKDWNLLESEREFSQKWKFENFPDKKCIGVVGQLKEKKGIDLLIQAFKGSQLIREKIGLLLVGDLDEDVQQQLADSEIEYQSIPFKDRLELLKYYGVCDAIAIPSYYDGMPNVLLEAGALGIPVIGADIGGIFDILNAGVSSMLFQAGNVESLRSILLKVATMEIQELNEKGADLQKIIHTNYTHEKELDNLVSAISNKMNNEIKT